ncbi:MAG: hypothetical protein RLZZ579_400 [Actinomycetota bacterium]
MLIGLTGGIASGKSTVAKVWEDLGGVHIDADILAREVVTPGSEGLARVVARFGKEILDSKGSLNRQALGSIVFSDNSARADLEAILHPLIQKLAQEKVLEAGKANVFYTIPLLVETQSPLRFDKIVTVSAPEAIRVQRLIESRGLTEEQAKERVAAQATDAQREAIADFVIDSDCSLTDLEQKAKSLWLKITRDPNE